MDRETEYPRNEHVNGLAGRFQLHGRNFAGIAAMALGTIFATTSAFSQTQGPPTSGPAEGGSPAWFFQGSFPDPTGNTMVAEGGEVTVLPRTPNAGRSALMTVCSDDIANACHGQSGFGVQTCLMQNVDKLSGECKTHVSQMLAANGGIPSCSHSPVCGNRMTDGVLGPQQGQGSRERQRVQWKQTMGYTFTYPYTLPQGIGGVPSVALDSKGNLWVYKRTPAGTPQLYEFGPDHKLLRSVGDDVIGHAYKAHGMTIDPSDNVWICDATLATVKEVSPDGKLLKTIGVSGHRGDWDEAKGQRLLWQPVMIAFAPNGDMYIAEGHANESPNDTDSPDPTNVSGAARILHFDKDGKFINQWYGDNMGPGKFYNSHAIAIDPKNGDVWIGDREEYRIVVYTADGKFLKTFSMRNLVCALNFDREGNPWMASGQDGQFLKLDHNGRVLGAIGNGMGIGPGQFIEASYWVFDKNDNLYAGDTSVGRITVMAAPKK
jgi:6-bladed beta-propeller